MLIPTYYLLSKIWDIFATRRRILLEINKNYFRGGEIRFYYILEIVRANSGLHDFIYLPFHGHLALQEIEEEGDDACIDEVCEHGADDGDDEERLHGVVVLIAYSAHVGHCIGGGTKAETAHASTQHGGIIVTA